MSIIVAILVLNLVACTRVLWGGYKPNAEERIALPFMGGLMLTVEIMLYAFGAMVVIIERVGASFPRKSHRVTGGT